jgi:hypothetical protein
MHLCVAGLLVGVNMPDDVVRETNDFVSGALGHLCETFCLGLVLEGVAREVDAYQIMSALRSRRKRSWFRMKHT